MLLLSHRLSRETMDMALELAIEHTLMTSRGSPSSRRAALRLLTRLLASELKGRFRSVLRDNLFRTSQVKIGNN